VAEEFVQACFGALEGLGESGTLHLPGVMGDRKMDGSIRWMSEIVVAPFDVIEEVARVLKGANDLSRLEGRNARGHVGL
jgi:hypothetical protein